MQTVKRWGRGDIPPWMVMWSASEISGMDYIISFQPPRSDSNELNTSPDAYMQRRQTYLESLLKVGNLLEL